MGVQRVTGFWQATGGGRGSASKGFVQCAVAMGSQSSVTYEIVRGRAKPGHTRCQAKRSSETMGIKAGNQDRLRYNQQPIHRLYKQNNIHAYSTNEVTHTS